MTAILGKLFLFLLSGFGYWEYFRSKHRINLYFAPVFTIAVQFLVLFAGGILHCLKVAALGLYIGGFVLLLWAARREKFRLFRPYCNMGYIFFLTAFGVVAAAVYGKQVSQIDNFTHWATVVKNMLSMDRFPTFEDTAVGFSTYPLGSSAWLYYFCRMTESAEYAMMWAQNYMIVSTILPLFSCARENRAVCTALISLMAGFFFCYNVPATELLVDTLMPLAGMAAALFVYHHYAADAQVRGYPVYYALALILWTMNIKHAALLYAVFALVLLVLLTGKGRGWKTCLVAGGAVLLFREIWNLHCARAFVNVSVSQHSMSADWFRLVVSEKTPESIRNTAKRIVVYILTRQEYLWFAAWILLLGALVWLFVRKEKGRYLAFLLGGIGLYGVYAAGILGMYIFSMPEYEALASFDRYMKSVDIALYYILAVFALQVLSEMASRTLLLPAAAALILTAAAGWYFQTGQYSTVVWNCCTAEQRQRLEQLIPEYAIEKRRSYLLCITPADDPLEILFPTYIWRYNMESAAVEQRIVEDPQQLNDAWTYDYVIILDEENPVISRWLQEQYPEEMGKQVICNFS